MTEPNGVLAPRAGIWERWLVIYRSDRPLILGILALAAIVAVALAIWMYGQGKAKQAVELAAANHTDTVLVRQLLVRVDSLVGVARSAEQHARAASDSAHALAVVAQAIGDRASVLAQVAQSRIQSIPQSVIAQSDPRVVSALNAATVALDSNRLALASVTAAMAKLQTANDSLWSLHRSDSALVAAQRMALDTARKEIAELRDLKTPRCGYLCWTKRIAIGGAAIGGAVLAGRASRDETVRIPILRATP